MTRIVSISIMLLAAAIGFGQSESLTFSLTQAQKYAVSNNLQIKNADLEIQEAKKKVWETTAIGLPQLSGSAQYQNFIDIPVQVAPASAFNPAAPAGEFVTLQFGLNNSLALGLSASQLLFDGSYFIGLKAAKSYVDMTRHDRHQTENDVRENVSSAYYMVIAAHESQKVLKNSLTSFEQLFEETKAVYEQGLIEVSDVDQLELSLNNLRSTYDFATNNLTTAKLLLNFHLGLSPDSEVTLVDGLELLVTSIDPEIVNAVFDVKENINFQKLETKEELDRLNLKNEQARALPAVAAFYSFQNNKYGNEWDFSDNIADGQWFPTQLVGLQLEMPIFSSGRSGARRAQAKINLEQTRNQKEQLKQQLSIGAASAKSEYKNALAQYENAKKSMMLSLDLYAKAQIKFKEGIYTSMELNQSKNQELNAQQNYIQSIVNVFNKKLALDKAFNKI